jgi:hypothetical protein
MSEVRDPTTDQVLPKPGGDFVQEFMINELDKLSLDDELNNAIRRGIESRRELGVRKYGTPLQTFNGRDALTDAWDESLDLLTYVYQIEMEDGDAGSLVGVAMSIVIRLTKRRLHRGDCF